MPARSEELVAATSLLLGASCAGCGRPALDLCPACLAALVPRPRRVSSGLVPVVAGGDHEDLLRRVVVAWKRRGHTRLTPVLARVLAASVCALEPSAAVLLVPVPTTGRSRRARGGDRVGELAARCAVELAAVDVAARVVPALALARTPADQVGLGAAERARNVAGAFRPVPRDLAGGEVVVVDDVVTTGATALEAVRALASGGVPVLGVAVVAARP